MDENHRPQLSRWRDMNVTFKARQALSGATLANFRPAGILYVSLNSQDEAKLDALFYSRLQLPIWLFTSNSINSCIRHDHLGIPALNLAMRSSILLGACVVLCLYFSRSYFIWSAIIFVSAVHRHGLVNDVLLIRHCQDLIYRVSNLLFLFS